MQLSLGLGGSHSARRTPIKYVGGKVHKADSIIRLWRQHSMASGHAPRVLHSAFLGGGSVEVEAARRGARVIAADLSMPVCNFWRWTLSRPDAVADAAEYFLLRIPVSALAAANRAYAARAHDVSVIHAGLHYALHCRSFGAMGLGGWIIDKEYHDGYWRRLVARLRAFRCPALSVERREWRSTLRRAGDEWVFCDPPYHNAPGVYARNGSPRWSPAEHGALWAALRRRRRWMLTIDASPAIDALAAAAGATVYTASDLGWVGYTMGVGAHAESNERLLVCA